MDISNEGFSSKLSDCMDLSGYSLMMILHRQQMNSHIDEIYNREAISITKLTVLTTGAKGEGVAKYFESDIDRLYTYLEMVCIHRDDVHTGNKDYIYEGSPMTMFISAPEGCSPGYTRLELSRLMEGNFADKVKDSLVKEGEKVYIANDFHASPLKSIMFDINAIPLENKKRSGPSLSASSLDISYDYVYGIIYNNKRHLEDWSKRIRQHDWPTSFLIERVLDTKGHVVPVASKNTKYLNTEWRICYTEAELLLLRSSNEFQIKVLILLKMVSKTFLHAITKEVSSYINKNVIFWMAEMRPSSTFTRDTLFERLIDSLCFLRDCLIEGRLESYMIGGKNLLEGRISKSQGAQLAQLINKLVSTKPSWLLQLKFGSAYEALQNSPTVLTEQSKKRDNVERLLLRRNLISKKVECSLYDQGDQCKMPEMLANDTEWKQLGDHLNSLVVPDFQSLEDSEINTVDLFKKRLFEMLS